MIRDWLEYFIICVLTVAALFIGLSVMPREVFAAECIRASYYGAESGNRTANGERFTGRAMTAAHRTLPFGTKLRVTYQGRSVVVRVNDRGPYIRGRSLDLSTAAARKLGMIRAGVAKVCITRLN